MGTITVEHHELSVKGQPAPIAQLTIDRPDKRNALTADMLDLITEHVQRLGQDASAGAIVLAGAEGVFSGGFDLKCAHEQPEALVDMLASLAAAVRAIRESELPVVAALEKAAIAGGCALVLAADIVVSHREAKLGYPVVGLGISPAVTAPILHCRATAGETRRLLLEGSLIEGAQGREIGLVDLIVDLPEDVVPRSQLIAASLAAKPSGAIGATKRWLGRIDGLDAHAQRLALDASLSIAGNPDQIERLGNIFGKGADA